VRLLTGNNQFSAEKFFLRVCRWKQCLAHAIFSWTTLIQFKYKSAQWLFGTPRWI